MAYKVYAEHDGMEPMLLGEFPSLDAAMDELKRLDAGWQKAQEDGVEPTDPRMHCMEACGLTAVGDDGSTFWEEDLQWIDAKNS